MKRHLKHVVSLMVATVCTALFLSCVSTSGTETALQYDESMTPENSCVIYFCMPPNDEVTFRQINPELDVDIQHFNLRGLFNNDWVIFKPCKPGSRYMLTKMKGGEGSGNYYRTWDMDFNPGQQILVIDVPKEPGVYCYGWINGISVAYHASDGKVFPVPQPDVMDKDTKRVINSADKAFEKVYGGTPWYDAYLVKKEQRVNAEE